MKKQFVGVIVFALACLVSSGQQPSENTHSPAITGAFVHETVTSLQSLIQANYFDTSAIPHIEAALAAAEQHGTYAYAKDLNDLAAELNETLSHASHDKHLYVGLSELPRATSIHPVLPRAERARMENFGIKQVEVLDGNVGYLKITAFYRANEGSEALETAMNFVSHTDALILDFRNNGGGSTDTAIQLLSYFFKQPNFPLLSIVPRSGEPTVFYTQTTGVAYRNENRPLYVLVSASTWSAGEAVPFILQEHHRATIIGEKTTGAANPASPWPINSFLSVTIPGGYIESSVNKTNWENKGVIPDTTVSTDKALDVAYTDALKKLMDSTTDAVKKQVLNRVLSAAIKP
jgi:retinol-binding protein 3